jgi:GNAT superfamily N-acetyltransferase
MSTQVTLRPARERDLDEAVAVINRESEAATGEPMTTSSELRQDWTEPGFTVDTDACIAETADGRIVGYADYANTRQPYARPFAFCSVDPDAGFQVDPAPLIRWAEERASKDIGKAPADVRFTLLAGTNEKNERVLSAWRAAGLTESRRFYQMRITFDGPPAPARIPDGYEIRALREDEQWKVFLAMQEAFRDHYGFTPPESLEKAFEGWKHHLITGQEIDPELLLIAVDASGEVAGGSLCSPTHGPFEDMGWVGSLAVRPTHRKKGLAEALLRRSFERFYEKGKSRAGLGVDAESLTNATRLYEKCGMHRHKVFVQLQKMLRDGREVANLG